jgi:peptidyl-prolyl cis-trans isomerase SurA
MMRFLVFLTCSFAFIATHAQTKKVIADKIVAQVGDKIILRSDIFNAIADLQRQGNEVPENAACQLTEMQLMQKTLVLQGERDSLEISEEEIEALLDNQIRGFIQMYGSEQALVEISGKSVFQLKDEFRQAFRDKKMAEQMRNKIVESVRITPTEVRSFFAKIPIDSLPFFESELQLSELILLPKANKDIEDYVARELYEYKRQVEQGTKKFDQLAKLYTEDPGSKENGGQYNINRSDKFWDPAFHRAVFLLKDGQISNVVKTKFGLHIIQMVSRAGDEAVIRHILRIPPVTDDEIKIAKNKLDTIRKSIVAGRISFGEAVYKYSDDDASKYTGGVKMGADGGTYISIDQLDKDMVPVLKTLKAGNISTPNAFTDERGRKAVRLVFLQNRTEPHRMNVKDDYNKISQMALEEKKQLALEKWFREHIPAFYLYIDKEFTDCDNMQDWYKALLEQQKN